MIIMNTSPHFGIPHTLEVLTGIERDKVIKRPVKKIARE
jgi:hypothetical protein